MSAPSLNLSLLPRPVGKRVRTLGHALEQVQGAMRVLQRRCAKGQSVQGLAPEWFHAWGGATINLADLRNSGGPWSAEIEVEDRDWLINNIGDSSTLPLPWAVTLLCLHLPVLRAFWRKELRAHRAELLQRVLPQVWSLDPTPLPHGSVIGGLNLASWHQLPDLLAKGRKFEVLSLEGVRQEVTTTGWPNILAQANQQKFLLLEHRHLPGGSSFAASWSANAEGWIDLDQQTF